MNRRTAVAGLGAALVLALPASAASAAPISQHFHSTFSDTTPHDTLCGLSGSSVDHGMDNVQVLGDGTFKDESQLVYTFTAAATGKSVQILNHVAISSALPADNGNGTATYVNTFNGIPEMIKLPNGAVLTADTGHVSFAITFDIASGNEISVTTTVEAGPHPILDSGFSLVCDVIIPALS